MKWMLVLVLLALPLGAQSKKILVEGHRGARWVLPENTLPAFHHAIEVGADVLELDLAVTKDNVLVISHDLEIKPATCKGPEGMTRVIRQLTVEEIKKFDCGWAPNKDFPAQQALPGTRMPTLDEALGELAPMGSFHFNIETKSNPARPELTPDPEEFAKLVLEQIRKHKIENRVVVQSFDFRTLHALKKLAPEIPRAALWATKGETFLEVAKRAGDVPVLSPHLSLVTPENVKQAHAAGLKVVPWTANQPEEWQKLIDADVDAIITDNPQGLVLYLAERNLH
jgi:glycerophosphoryl diester phosphodiesterase